MERLKLIEEAITAHYGPRCKKKDTDDFPEITGQRTGRCPICLVWEDFDYIKEALK